MFYRAMTSEDFLRAQRNHVIPHLEVKAANTLQFRARVMQYTADEDAGWWCRSLNAAMITDISQILA